MEKSLALLGTAACVAIAATGCGSSSSSTSSSSATADSGGGSGSTSSPGGSSTRARDGESRPTRSASNPSSSSSSRDSSAVSRGPDTNDNGARLGADTSKTGDNSIQTYGSDVEGPEKAAAIAAMHSFALAIAARDYAKVCAGLSSRIREGLARPNQGCPELLRSLLVISPSEAREAANGTVTQVRVGGGNAFVLFRPVGSNELQYFVMSLEDGDWKALGLTVGEPVEPSGPPGE